MPLRSTYDGRGFERGYAGIEAQAFLDADRVNGNVRVPDGADGIVLPRLTNGQVAAFVRAWQRAAARSRSPAFPEAQDLLVAALGWRKAGDRFVMTREHGTAAAPPELLEYYWRSVKALAERLDASGTKLAPLIVDYSWSGYEQAARDAWRTMQIERGTAAPGAPAAPAESSGWGGAVILIALVLALGVSARKRKG